MSFPQKYYSISYFIIDDFTLRLLKNIEKMILCQYILSMLRVSQRVKGNSVLTSA